MAGRCGCSASSVTGVSVADTDSIVFSGIGSIAAPFAAEVVVDPVANNQLQDTATGLRVMPVDSDLEVTGISNSEVGGSPPAVGSGGWRMAAGTVVDITDGDGFIFVTFPVGSFVSGIVSIQLTLGDDPVSSSVVVAVEQTTVTLTEFRIRAFYGSTDLPVISGTLRVNWLAIGW